MKRIFLSLFLSAVIVGGALAQAPVVDADWSTFVIREANDGTSGPPLILDNDVYEENAIEFVVFAGGQKAALGTDLINGATVGQIATLHIDRLDDVLNSDSLYGPYFNIWVTDGDGHYAVIANEPSNGVWEDDRWDVPDWDFLSTKVAKVYETPDAAAGTSWVHDHAYANGWTGVLAELTFAHVADLVIEPPTPDYIAEGANLVGTGAPREKDTNIAYGYNWIFGDTLENYVSGNEGFVVNNYTATADFPVENLTQIKFYATIQAAIEEAVPWDEIVVAAGHYEEQLYVTVDNLSITGAGVGATYIDSPISMVHSFTTSGPNIPVVFVDHADGVTFADLTLDGLGRGNTNPRFQGFGYYNAGGSLTNVHVTNIIDTPFSGAQAGVGVYAYTDDGGPHMFDMTDVQVDLFQKSAVAISGEGLTGHLLRVDTDGAGPTAVTAQNGIQIGWGAVATCTDCDVTDIAYTGPDWSASGVMSAVGAVAHFVDCNIDGCQTSAYFSDGGGSFNNSTVTNPLGDALYAFSGGAKAAGGDTPLPAYPFDLGMGKNLNKAAISVSIDGSTFTGNGATDSWGPTAFGYGPVNFSIDNSTVTNWDWGVVFYDFGGLDLNAQGAGNTLSGNTSFGAFSNAANAANLVGNFWGDDSGPLHPIQNAGGLGNAVSDNILYIPWVGRSTSVVADLAATPNGEFYWEGTPAVGVDGDFAPGFDPGAFQAPGAYTRYGFDPEPLFGREVLVGELYRISYYTKKGTLHNVDAADWYFQLYTDPYDNSPGSSWYGNRINSEPYFSDSLVETAGEWSEWQTDAGLDNRLRFFDSSSGYYGSYTDGFLSDLGNDPTYAAQPIMAVILSLGTAWADGFEGLLDGLTIELVSGETLRMDFVSGNAVVSATPAATGPLNCDQSQVITFGVELTAGMPDVFLYNAVVRASAEVSFGEIEDLYPFGTINNNFLPMDNGDGSWTIAGSTVGSPTSPITAPGSANLFSIEFLADAEGTASITFDSLVLRDPENNTIPVVLPTATIEIDCSPPAPVTGIAAAPGHKKIDVTWAHDGFDVDHYVVFSGLWYDTNFGVSAYPEYDDLDFAVVPTAPADYQAAVDSDEWVPLTAVAVTNQTQTWTDPPSRGVYYYTVFAVDAAGNASAAPATLDRATNYWLGDVDQSPGGSVPDGLVDPFDMNVLGTYFGSVISTNDPGCAVDVGPTDDWSRLGIPSTDSVVNFEDLMVFAMNFGIVTQAKTNAPVGKTVDLAWVLCDDGSLVLRLVGGNGLKGLRVTADAVVSGVTAGQLLDEQSELTFLQNVGEKLDTSVAVMGVNNTFTGSGDLLVVRSDSEIALSQLTITARAIDNSRMELRLDETSGVNTPRVFALQDNYPNPFNPRTKISFSLPASQHVELTVFGVDGRRVATLLNETRSAGLHEVVWAGQDAAGKSVASGTYFFRIQAGPYSDVKKMTLMK